MSRIKFSEGELRISGRVVSTDTPAARGERIKLLVDTIASAVTADGKTIDHYDKVLMAGAAVEVLYPSVAVDMPSWPEVKP